MKSVFAFILLGSLLIACGKKSGPVTAAKYHCPMHPTVVSDKPGDCPICGMKLVPTNDQEHTAQSSGKKKTLYRSTMNPNEVSDHPGKDSMGMDMVAFEVAEGAEQSTVPGLAAVSITPVAQERMGLTFGKVEKRLLAREVRTSARIVADETKLYRVTVKIEGWVEKLFVATTGQHVEKGAPLLTIYSPDLVAAQREFLIAQKSGSSELLAAVRRRLKLWDITDEQVAKLEAAGEGEKVLTLYAPASGFVQEKMVVAGQKIMPGESLMTVADLSTVWADADIYQSDLPYLKTGMSAEVNVADKKFTGQVIFISPTLDPMTRTAKARLEIPNPELLLKPEMYGTAKLSYELGERLALPETAVMRTGERTYAFKSGGDHQIVPVQINTGGRSDGWVEVIDGLSEGDQVVTSANFLVDSESSMKAALAGMSGGHQH